MAKKYHPDLHPNDPEAEAKFKEVNEAASVLTDPDKRARYDQFGHAGVDNNGMGGGYSGGGFGDFGGFGGFGDIFDTIFGGGGSMSNQRNRPRRGADIETTITVTFEEAAFGTEKRSKNSPYGRLYGLSRYRRGGGGRHQRFVLNAVAAVRCVRCRIPRSVKYKMFARVPNAAGKAP